MTATVAPSARALWDGGLAGRAGTDDDEVETCMGVMVPGCARRARGRQARAGVAASYSRTAAVIDTLRLSATPCIGSDTAVTPSPVHASREALGLRSEDERDRPAQVGLRVGDCAPRPARRARRCRPTRSQARTAALRPAATGSAKIVPERGADRVGVEQVGARVGDDDGVRARGVGRAQHRAEVARLLDALEHDDERIRRQHAGEASSDRSGMRTVATSPSERSPYASRSRTPPLTGTISAPPAAARSTASCPAGVERCSIDEHLDRACPARERPVELARAVDERQAGLVTRAPVAQRGRGLDARVLRARDRARVMRSGRLARHRARLSGAGRAPMRRARARPRPRAEHEVVAARRDREVLADERAEVSPLNPGVWALSSTNEGFGPEIAARSSSSGGRSFVDLPRARAVAVRRRVEDDPVVAVRRGGARA